MNYVHNREKSSIFRMFQFSRPTKFIIREMLRISILSEIVD